MENTSNIQQFFKNVTFFYNALGQEQTFKHKSTMLERVWSTSYIMEMPQNMNVLENSIQQKKISEFDNNTL